MAQMTEAGQASQNSAQPNPSVTRPNTSLIDVSGEEPGLQSVAMAMGTLCGAEQGDRRRLRLAQEIEGAGEKHGDGPCFRERCDAVLVEIFEVVGRQRAVARRQPGAAEIGKLLGVKLHRKPMRLRRVEYPGHLLRRKGDPLAESIDGISEPAPGDGRKLLAADGVDVAVGVTGIFRRHRMGAEEGGFHCHRPLRAKPPRRRQHAGFGFRIEAIARLDLDGRDAFGDHRVEAFAGGVEERGVIGGARRRDSGENAAAGAGDLLVACPGDAHLEFLRAIAAEDEMGVAVDEPGRDPAALQIVRFLGVEPGRQIACFAHPDDAAAGLRDGAALDDSEAGPILRHGHQPGVDPEAVNLHARPPPRNPGSAAFIPSGERR